MHALPLRVLCWMAAVVALGAATTQPQKLGLGVPAERPLAGGEAHSYGIDPPDRIATTAGARLLLTVEQRGIDVVVEVRRAPLPKPACQVRSRPIGRR